MARSLPSLSRRRVFPPGSAESDPQEALAKASRWTAIFIGRTPTNTYRMAHSAKRRPVGLMLEEREETEKKMTRKTVNFAGAMSVFFLGVLQIACEEREPASDDLYGAVDELYDTVVTAADRFDVIAEIDHSRLAAENGETMPPARVVIFSDPIVNTSILQQEPQAGLDLPFRVLAYAEGHKPAVIPTTAEYLRRRHGLADGPALQKYEESILSLLGAVPRDAVVDFDVSSLGKGQGIVTLSSAYGFEETIERLKAAIMAESDTIWFGDIDYRDQAASLGVELPAVTLLLFGAPGPGGKAMAERPRMGLDAFCQKVLVHQMPSGQIEVLFNEMPALSRLHYGDSALPHMVITKRMRDTLGAAVEK